MIIFESKVYIKVYPDGLTFPNEKDQVLQLRYEHFVRRCLDITQLGNED